MSKQNAKQENTIFAPKTESELLFVDYSPKQFSAMTEFAPGIWVVFAQGGGQCAQHFLDKKVIPATATESDVFRAVLKLKKAVNKMQNQEIEMQKLNPDIKSRLKTNKMLEMFIVTANGVTIRPYNRNVSAWDNIGFFQRISTLLNKDARKFQEQRATDATMKLLGFNKDTLEKNIKSDKPKKSKKSDNTVTAAPEQAIPETPETKQAEITPETPETLKVETATTPIIEAETERKAA